MHPGRVTASVTLRSQIILIHISFSLRKRLWICLGDVHHDGDARDCRFLKRVRYALFSVVHPETSPIYRQVIHLRLILEISWISDSPAAPLARSPSAGPLRSVGSCLGGAPPVLSDWGLLRL